MIKGGISLHMPTEIRVASSEALSEISSHSSFDPSRHFKLKTERKKVLRSDFTSKLGESKVKVT